jgi:hypothetical protein
MQESPKGMDANGERAMTAGDTRAVSTVHGPKHNRRDTTKCGLPPATSSVGSRAQPSRCLRSLVVCVATVTAITLSQPAQAITIRVPQDYPKIQDALLWAANGDEIVVSPGVYVENINFNGKNVVLRSTSPTNPGTVATTIIDLNWKGRVVTFDGSETSSCLLSGFTIRNGIGGIYGNGAKARIEHNTITGNSGEYGGGLYGCNGTIQNNVITNNSAVYGGGLNQCNGTIQNNTITGNSARYGGGLFGCDGTIQNNDIAGNWARGTGSSGGGGGLYECNGTIQNNLITSNSARSAGGGSAYGGGLYRCHGTIRSNTITSNTALSEGGGLSGCTGIIVNCIFWGNAAPVYSQISPDSIPSYSCIQGLTVAGGNIKLDPRFVGPNDFHLRPDSPCIDAGTNANCPATDKDGNQRPFDGNADGKSTCDVGAYECVTVPCDLVIATGLVSPEQARCGDTVHVSFQAQNIGKGAAGANWVHVYLSDDGSYSAEDLLWVHNMLMPPLNPGQRFDYTTASVVPFLPPRTYHVLVQCDVLDNVGESDETNNIREIGSLGVFTGPDLAVTRASITPGYQIAGGTVRVSLGVRNWGDRLAGENWAHVYLSRDAVYGGDDFLWIQGILVPPLNPGQTLDYSATATVPYVARATYHVLVQCDVLNSVAESNENNNSLDAGLFSITPGVDLTVTSGSLQPSGGRAAQVIQVAVRVANIGLSQSGGNWTHVYLSQDSVYDLKDRLWIQGIGISPLDSGKGYVYSGTAHIPNLPSGSYHVIAYCDIINEVDEWDEDNNWKEIGTLSITTAANKWEMYR